MHTALAVQVLQFRDKGARPDNVGKSGKLRSGRKISQSQVCCKQNVAQRRHAYTEQDPVLVP